MKKFAFEGAGVNGFEMPSFKVVGLEKESNIAFATPNTVYKPKSGGGFTRSDKLRAALEEELDILDMNISGAITS